MQQNNEWALAPAGCFSRISRKFNPFSAACLAPAVHIFSYFTSAAAKADACLGAFVARLKSCPVTKPLLSTIHEMPDLN
jgi:hypothetical protein